MPTPEQDQKRKSMMIKELISGDGFKVLHEDLMDESRRLTTELIECKDVSGVIRLQAEIKAIKLFFDKIYLYANMK